MKGECSSFAPKEKLIVMEISNNIIGKNAGTVWNALCGKSLSWENLLTATKLQPLELSAAIGWLAREDKICIRIENGVAHFETFVEQYYH